MTTTTDALAAVVSAEDAAIFTYGVITAFAATARRGIVADFTAEHRAARDAAAAAITAAGGEPPLAAAGYVLPVEVKNSTTAAQAAVDAEHETAVAYRALLEKAEDEAARKLGLEGLARSAVRAATWRAALRQSPFTEAMPGNN